MAEVRPLVGKAEFARRRGVTPGRVSQWLAQGKISGAAIVGTGRNAQIDETIACAQLNERLDGKQRALQQHVAELLAPPLPLDERAALELGRAISAVVEARLPAVAHELATVLPVAAPTVLPALRRAWRSVCEGSS